MAYTDIDDPSAYFQTTLYAGNGGTQSVTNGGNSDLQPDWLWIKDRDDTYKHILVDSVRGATKHLASNTTAAEITNTANVTGFASDGFALASDGNVNANADKYVAWQWKTGTSFSNDASSTSVGSIDSAGSVSTTAGFSIVSYTGTGSAGTIKHGLSTAPKIIIQKNRDETQPWWTYVESIGAGGQLRLNTTAAAGSDGGVLWNSTAPTSSVFSVGDNTGTNGSADKCIAYCFADVQGYSKFGSYVGNGNADGTFVYTGFKVGWVMIKRTDTGNSWLILDNKRIGFNPDNNYLLADTSDADGTDNFVDLYSNGFKIMSADAAFNASGGTYIYMAFAENPFTTSTGVPATAR